MVDVFEEVNEELKDEEFHKWLRKFGPAIIVLSVLLVCFTAGKVIYSNHKSSVNQAQTVVLANMQNLELEKDMAKVIAANAQDLDAKHKFLSDFLVAAAHLEEGDLVAANATYEKIIANKDISEEYREISTIYVVQNILNMEDGDLQKADAMIKPLLFKDNAFYYIAIEKKALIEAKLGNIEEAKSILDNLSADYDAPEEVKSRAEKLKTLY